MFPSGTWRGFWVQKEHGRQEMEAFELHFNNGAITGKGIDMVGPFHFRGVYDVNTGKLMMGKKYIGKHRVYYEGQPDGEGCISGTWRMELEFAGSAWRDKGPFLMRPELPKATGHEPIQEIG